MPSVSITCSLFDCTVAYPEFSFFWHLPDWEPNHHHWRGPSWFGIKHDGTIEMGAAYLANMKREDGPFDIGPPATFGVKFKLLDATGKSVWYDARYISVGLKYKHEQHNISRAWPGAPIYASLVAQSATCEMTREISTDIVPQTPTVPVIDIPWHPLVAQLNGDKVGNG